MNSNTKWSDLLELLIKKFEDTGWPLDLNYAKLIQRSNLSEDVDENGWSIIEIERHRSILGAEYLKGLPMDAYQTYYMQYAINGKTGDVKELPEKNGSIHVNVSRLASHHIHSDFEVRIEAIDEDAEESTYFLITDSDSKQKQIAKYHEAEDFLLSFSKANVDYFTEQLSYFELDDVKKQKYISDYEACIRSKLLTLAEEVWENRYEL
jgi:hypothetical protein